MALCFFTYLGVYGLVLDFGLRFDGYYFIGLILATWGVFGSYTAWR